MTDDGRVRTERLVVVVAVLFIVYGAVTIVGVISKWTTSSVAFDWQLV